MTNEIINIYVELLDEGTETWWPAQAVALGNGLFQILKPEKYDPEFEYWEFVPGDTVRLEESVMYDGTEGLLAKHPDPNTVKIWVESSEKHAPQIRETHALKIADDLYKVLPTPHYTPQQLWKFPPGSVVRLRKEKTPFPGEFYWLAVEAS